MTARPPGVTGQRLPSTVGSPKNDIPLTMGLCHHRLGSRSTDASLGIRGGGEVTFSNLGSADDVAPVGHSAQHLEPTRGCFEAKAAQLGLCFSWTRTKAQNLAAGQVMQNIQVNSCSVEGGEECI